MMVNVQNSMVGNMFPLVRSWDQNFVEGLHLRIACKDNIVFAAEQLLGGFSQSGNVLLIVKLIKRSICWTFLCFVCWSLSFPDKQNSWKGRK